MNAPTATVKYLENRSIDPLIPGSMALFLSTFCTPRSMILEIIKKPLRIKKTTKREAREIWLLPNSNNGVLSRFHTNLI